MNKPSWSRMQQRLLAEYLEDPNYTVLFHNTDQHGFSANGGDRKVRNKPGATHKGYGIGQCTAGALHATTESHRWKGCRVWIVALEDARHVEGDKWCTNKRRVVLGELLPEDCIMPTAGVRLGMKDLSGADLSRADLYGADLSGANLSGANLSGANLSGANLSRADLYGANLSGANLSRADLYGQDVAALKARGAVL